MKFDSVSFMKRKNLGSFEHEEISISAKVEEGESVESVLALLKHTVTTSLNGAPAKVKTPPMATTPHEEDAQPELPIEEPKKEKKSKKKEEAPKEEVPNMVVYNPAIKKHKDILADALDKHFAGWDSEANLAHTKACAEKMANKPFLDAKTGEVLDVFITSFGEIYEKPKKKSL